MHPADWQLVDTNKIAPPVSDRFTKWAKAALAIGVTTNSRSAEFIPRDPAGNQDTRNEFRAPITKKPDPDTSLRLEQAITLGDKTYLTDEVTEPFIRASTYHIFAVDGLRMAIIFGIFFTSFRAFRVPRTVAATWC